MRKPTNFDYNLIVIGGGAAGLVTSYTAATMKAKVALIEKDKMGGECLNTGCVPSKSLIKSAKVMHELRRASEYGIKTKEVNCDFSSVMDRIQRVIKKIEPHDSVERFEGVGVECIKGEAKFLDPWSVEVNGKILRSRKIVVATGSRPFVPDIPGLKETAYLTNENLWRLKILPQSFVILGGGAIGVEMAQAFQRLGSQVTLIETHTRILSSEDPEVSHLIHTILEGEGVKILCGVEVQEIRNKKLKLKGEDAGEYPFDEILIATGRRGNAEKLGLEKIGVQLDEKGFVRCDLSLQTSVPSVYAIGDANGERLLTHMASAEAGVASLNSLIPFWRAKIDEDLVPRCTYTDPEIAHVGETEQSLKKKGVDYTLTTYSVDDLDRAITESETKGIVRVFTKRGSDKILGATVVSSQASAVINEFTFAMTQNLGLKKILDTIHVYPGFGEIPKEVATIWRLNHIGDFLLRILRSFFSFQR